MGTPTGLRHVRRNVLLCSQVSLEWILAHLYSDVELLARAREEAANCSDLEDYDALQVCFANRTFAELQRVASPLCVE